MLARRRTTEDALERTVAHDARVASSGAPTFWDPRRVVFDYSAAQRHEMRMWLGDRGLDGSQPTRHVGDTHAFSWYTRARHQLHEESTAGTIRSTLTLQSYHCEWAAIRLRTLDLDVPVGVYKFIVELALEVA